MADSLNPLMHSDPTGTRVPADGMAMPYNGWRAIGYASTQGFQIWPAPDSRSRTNAYTKFTLIVRDYVHSPTPSEQVRAVTTICWALSKNAGPLWVRGHRYGEQSVNRSKGTSQNPRTSNAGRVSSCRSPSGLHTT